LQKYKKKENNSKNHKNNSPIDLHLSTTIKHNTLYIIILHFVCLFQKKYGYLQSEKFTLWGRLVLTACVWICKHVGGCETVPLKANSQSQ